MEAPETSLHFGWLIPATVLLAVLGATINDLVEALISGFTHLGKLYAFSHIDNDKLYLLDLTAGPFMVAFSEELVFRKMASSWLREAGYSTLQIVLISAWFFSIAHWGRGFGTMLSALLMGCLFMVVYLKIGRLWPPVAAHWIIDFQAFGPGY
ncbi:CPBP family intramembrane glutamic endopeptidase [Hoeflea sp. TYP-13]|uniref:CPBP family intramembrane glutamic endopeptidase n=1 Tax=Hoeflea sp. TYP-13 TaxID=3230023 RepID=UPI0034C66656